MKKVKIIGREEEWKQIGSVLSLGRNVLIEGPVGVGKTFLVLEILREKKKAYLRVDGDTRYTEQKLTGWFDPPLVLKKGYTKETFVEGPLVEAMKNGSILFINELNRMPEAVQNILLPAMDERQITLPKIGVVNAKAGFSVIATQNPREFTATHALSEALLDRFEMVHLEYQSQAEEDEILAVHVPDLSPRKLLSQITGLVRATRVHPSIKRGASPRAAIAIGELMLGGVSFEEASLIALPSRIEMVSTEEDPREVIRDLLRNQTFPELEEKKKSPSPKSRPQMRQS